MYAKRCMMWKKLALGSLAGTLGPMAALCLTATPAVAAPAPLLAPAATSACAAQWNAATAYNGGDEASENGINYTANWWTQGDDPATSSGPGGSGKPWTAVGACGGDDGSGGGGDSGGSGGQCAAAWSASAVYNGGDEASENGVNYTANWWTQGADPATHHGATGSGQPWTVVGDCSGSGGGDNGGGDDGGSGGGDGGGDGGGTGHPPAPAGFVMSPYKDITINLNWNTDVMSTKVTGSLQPLLGSNGVIATQVPGLHALTLAFASGTCGSESWGGVPGQAFADANIGALDAAGIDYIVSTGGQAGSFNCSSPSGMTTFINRYMSSHMIGVDFDIEGGQTPAQINALVSQVAYAESIYPNLRFSFTLATLAASDGSHGGVNSLGAMVVNAVKNANLSNYTINLMVMDYGAAGPGVCVVSNGSCEMGQSAIQAAENLEAVFGIPASHIELTPMIGVNDVSSELFTVQDVDTVVDYAINNNMAGVHFWSFDRDTPCASDYASPTCNSVPSTSVLEYTKRFVNDVGN